MNIKEQIVAKIEEIYPLVCQFVEAEQTKNPFSLFDGKPGAALFLYQYAHYYPEKRKECYDHINRIIEDAFEYIVETPDVKTSYCDGIIGILWLTQFLRNEGVIEMEAEDLPEDIIQELSEYSISQTIDMNNCDLLHGGFGFWAFLLESMDLPEKQNLLRAQLDALHKIKIETAEGLNWKIDLDIFQEENSEKIHIDQLTSTHLGLAHGTSFILALLAKTKIQGYFEEETEELIHKGLAHIRSLKIKQEHSAYVYPMVVVNGKPVDGGRLAWCNGDLSVANAFWLGWKATGKEEYKTEALEIIQAASRMNVKNAGALDAGLCHGTGGVAQIFKKFYWDTKEEQYARASDDWITATLEMANYTDGYAGYKTYSSEAYGGPRLEYGFLSGISGIGSALLTALSKTPTTWDRVLQIC